MKPISSRRLALSAVAALALVAAPALQAAKKSNAASLKGTYHLTLVEITVTDDAELLTIDCNGWGRIAFDGIDGATIEAGENLCNGEIGGLGESSFTYTVDPDGKVELLDDSSSPTTPRRCSATASTIRRFRIPAPNADSG